MSNVTRTLSNVKRRLCRAANNRFDRRYRSLSALQQLATMGATVGSVLLAGETVQGGTPASTLLILLPLALFPLLSTLFAWWNER